jgi:hypothetical protein
MHLPHDAVAAPPTAGAARPAAQVEAPQHHWVAALQDLGVGDARVGHVRVDAAAAVPAGPRTGTARDCLVVPHARVAKREVVHAPLLAAEDREMASLK